MILLYHLIFPDATPSDTWNAGKVLRLSGFKKQVSWLKKYYHIISVNEYLSNQTESRNKIALTFDDGYHQTIDLVVPFLQDQGIPATFFLNTSNLDDDKLLWFVYINALCFEKTYGQLILDSNQLPLHTEEQCHATWQTLIKKARASQDPIGFSNELAARYPLPEEVILKYSGVTRTQLATLGVSRLFEVGGHTHRHPYLDQLNSTLQRDEIVKNKQVLESFTKRDLRFFAYPGGFYNHDSISIVQQAGFQAALAVIPGSYGTNPLYELPRTGIYSSSMVKFILKTSGLVDIARKMIARLEPLV